MRFAGLALISVVAIRIVIVAAPQDAEYLLVEDPRPMAGAVHLVESRCHCIVTYEDVRWRADQVEDLPGAAIGTRAPKIPAGHPFMFTVSRAIASQAPVQIEHTLREALDAYERTNEAGVFRVAFDEPMFHVSPATGAPLDAAISIPAGTRSLDETVRIIRAAAAASTRARINLGTAPTNLMLQARVTLEATNEPARDVLARGLMLTGRKLSWQLLYDFGYDAYYLNIHTVR
jgi:hypothetical protein